MRKQTWLKYKKLWGEQIVHLPEKCWSKHINLHHCVGGLDETSWTITWGTSQKANTSINIFFNKCRQSCKAVGPMLNIWCLSNGKLNLAKANFQKSKSVLRSFNFVIGKRESRALSILGCAFRLGFSTRQKVPTIGCHKSISWPPIVFTIIMKKREVLEREDMSAEKGRELDAVFATWVVGKKAKRLGPKQKDHLASQVDTSVENIQDYWLCYRRNNLKWVRRTVLFLIGILCEQNSWACMLVCLRYFYFC